MAGFTVEGTGNSLETENVNTMSPKEVLETMLKQDSFSRWLGIDVLEVKAGYCKLGMTIRADMLNGFGIAHGGISFSLADSALAFASNSTGIKSLSIETSINHVESLKENDEILAEAFCETETEKLGHYKVTITLKKQPEKKVALFKGIVYKTSKSW